MQVTVAGSTELARATSRAREYVAHSKAQNTLRAYRADWSAFVGWCRLTGQQALPAAPDTVAGYLAAKAQEHKPATLQRALASIGQAHRAAGLDSPTGAAVVRETWKGITRTHGTAPRQKAPATTEVIRAMVATLPDNLLGLRDRALLVTGFAGAFRRSELVGLNVEDLHFGKDGVTVNLRRSKTDQQGQGRTLGLPYGSNPVTCPVRCLRDWLTAAGITTGPLFRSFRKGGTMQPGRLSDKGVALVVKKTASAVGLNPADFSGHSLRAGHATAAAERGADLGAIADQTGHKSLAMVRRYVRAGSLFTRNSAAVLGL